MKTSLRTIHLAIVLLLFTLAAAAQPIIATGGVLNGASFVKDTPVGPGSLVSIFGTNLSTTLLTGDTVPLSTSIAGSSVTFNGIPAGLFFVSSGQINAQVPWNVLPSGTNSGNVNAVVTVNGTPSAPVSVPVNQLAPGIFTIPNGVGYAIAINPDGSLAAPAGAIPGFPTHPAAAGDALIILATGLGPVDIPVANGAASSDTLRTTVTKPTATIGNASATVLFSGLSPQFPGINQVNIIVPSGVTGDSLPLVFTSGGVSSPTTAIISVH